MSNFVTKVGHFLSPSLHKHSLPGEKQEQLHGFQKYSLADLEKLRHSNGHAADTSSVTSFLLGILSSSNAKYPKRSHTPQAPEEAVHSSNVSALLESWEHDDDNKEQDPELSRESTQESQHEYESKESINLSSQLRSLKECPPHSAMQPTLIIASKLPPLSDESSLLSEDFRAFIALALPTIAKDRHWIMLYSTAKHGTSMRTLYQKSSPQPGPFLLVIGDLEGAIFGGLATAPLKPTAQRKYCGTSDTFVFTNIHKDPQLFKATGANRYYLLCTNDAIYFGGGGHFALHLDDTL